MVKPHPMVELARPYIVRLIASAKRGDLTAIEILQLMQMEYWYSGYRNATLSLQALWEDRLAHWLTLDQAHW